VRPEDPRTTGSHLIAALVVPIVLGCEPASRIDLLSDRDRVRTGKVPEDVTNDGCRGLHSRRIFVSSKKPENKPSDCFIPDSFSGMFVLTPQLHPDRSTAQSATR
jgi:hypothetical protein